MIKLSPQLIRTPLALSIVAVLSSMTPTVASAGARLEETIVTATKTDEMLSDVPISLTVVSGADVEKFNIQRFEDVAPYVPNFHLTQGGISNVINIRGIASGNQAGFEQSVGTFIDGVYRGRGIQSRFAFLDIGSVEVLRGPQGTLFGKNTVAGALNIKSAKPTEELSGSLKAAYNIDHEETEVTGIISGAMSDNLRGRLALMDRQRDKGWGENTFSGQDVPRVDEWAGRGTLEWDITDETVATLKYEHGAWDNVGSMSEMKVAGPLEAVGVEGGLNAKSSIAAINPITGLPDPVMDLGGTDRLFEGNLDEVALTIEHYTDYHTFTAILGYSEYEYERRSDINSTPFALLRYDDFEEQEQGSLELRVISDFDGDLQYIAGAYYQHANLTTDGLAYVGIPTVYTLLDGGCTDGGGEATKVPGDKDATVANNLIAGKLPLVYM